MDNETSDTGDTLEDRSDLAGFNPEVCGNLTSSYLKVREYGIEVKYYKWLQRIGNEIFSNLQ